ncbi:hypothetical protein [Neomegalonema sp.]|uniref:P-type ATPase n=1 Tax=Neomegalonema sp. TaxID=2039713 RepID=UPI002618269A|nr:hypothetical protein [Neomegalonema sp.]MDD2867462.1 hypothetical protein [Neomegalonema sp.]
MSQIAPRLVLGASSLVIHEAPFLRAGEEADLRAFLRRVFALEEVRAVEIDRSRGLSRLRHEAQGDLAGFWRRLGQALRAEPPEGGVSAEALFLGAPGPIRARRFGRELTSFRLRLDGPDLLRIGHPLLRRRADLRFRLEEELAASPEALAFRRDPVTAEMVLRLASRDRSAARLAADLERAWPRLLEGPADPPSSRRLAVAAGLLGVSLAGTTVAPALLPVAVAGAALFGAPNLLAAVRDLRRGRVGLRALHATGLLFFLATRSPLTSTLLAALTQFWPWLARRAAIRSQRALLAPWRRPPGRAWLVLETGEEVEVSAGRLAPGDLVVLRRGDRVAADGRIERGLAAVVAAEGTQGPPGDRQAGDLLRAGETILDGEAFLRVERPAAESRAAVAASFLPHGPFAHLPSLAAAERVADRNARPALALAWGNLLATGVLRRSQGILRPDYATAPRLSAQLAAQGAYVEALRGGALFRRPEALERLSEADVVVLDESAPLIERPLEIAEAAALGVREREVLAWAAAVLEAGLFTAKERRAVEPRGPIRRRAGAAWYVDQAGRRIEIASEAYLLETGFEPATSPLGRREAAGEAAPRPPVWVLRDGEAVGRIAFREGAARPAREALERLRRSPGRALRVLYLAQGDKAAAEALGAALGADHAFGGLSPQEKARFIRGLERKALWIGDGADPASAAALAVSHVSFSTAEPSAREAADALLLSGLEGARAAREAAHRRRATVAADGGLITAANLLALAGAFRANFSGFQSGLASNAATGVVAARSLLRLERLRREAERRALAARRAFTI